MTAPRPKKILIDYAKRYPGAWRQVDMFRQDKGKDLPDWPDWCFLPLAAAHAVVTSQPGDLLEQMAEVGILGAMAAWRVTQGIYRFDPDLYASVVDTPVSGDIPCEVLYQLPEWCVYVETPGMMQGDEPIHGFFAYLEHDVNSGRPELRLVVDCDSGLHQIILHLGSWSLKEAIDKAAGESIRQAVKNSFGRMAGQLADMPELRDYQEEVAEPILSLLLFICSQASEVGTADRRPANPVPKRTKQGWRLFPADKTTQWDVGVRIGAALRRAQSEQPAYSDSGGNGTAKRPHIRRAHWHGYWTGPRDPEKADQRKFGLLWMPPMAINMTDPDDMPAVIRPVK